MDWIQHLTIELIQTKRNLLSKSKHIKNEMLNLHKEIHLNWGKEQTML